METVVFQMKILPSADGCFILYRPYNAKIQHIIMDNPIGIILLGCICFILSNHLKCNPHRVMLEKISPMYAVLQFMASRIDNSKAVTNKYPTLALLCVWSIFSISSGKHNEMNIALTLGLFHVPPMLNNGMPLSKIPIHCNRQITDS